MRRPTRVRAVLGGELVVADADDVLVLDAPSLWPLAATRASITPPPYRHAARLADLLDLPLASDEVPGLVKESGDRPAPRARRAGHGVPCPAPLGDLREHDALAADGTDVPWRYLDDELHAAATEKRGARPRLGEAGHWAARHLLASLLTERMTPPGCSPRPTLTGDGLWRIVIALLTWRFGTG